MSSALRALELKCVINRLYENLHIGFLSSGLQASSGGAPVSEAELAKELATRHSVVVFCHHKRYDRNFARAKGVEGLVTLYGSIDVIGLFLGRGALYRCLYATDLLHVNGYWRWENTVFAWRACREQKPFVLHPRGMMAFIHRKVLFKKWFHLFLGRYLVEKSAALIALSQFERDRFIAADTVRQKTKVIPNGIIFVTTPLGCQGSGKYFLYYGRIEQRKNLLFLLGAFADYCKKGGTKRLILMGPVERGYDRQIRQRARFLGVDEYLDILLPEYDDKKYKRVVDAAAVVYPALEEAFGRVPFEAISVGVTPIIPDASGAAEYLQPYLSQTIYAANDAKSLSQILIDVENTVFVSQVAAARRWVLETMIWPRVADRVDSLYKVILNERKEVERSDSNGQMSRVREGGQLGR